MNSCCFLGTLLFWSISPTVDISHNALYKHPLGLTYEDLRNMDTKDLIILALSLLILVLLLVMMCLLRSYQRSLRKFILQGCPVITNNPDGSRDKMAVSRDRSNVSRDMMPGPSGINPHNPIPSKLRDVRSDYFRWLVNKTLIWICWVFVSIYIWQVFTINFIHFERNEVYYFIV